MHLHFVMPLIGSKAPLFKAPAVINGKDIVENFSLDQFIGHKEVIFLFYPKDFTFVCPTELIALQEQLGEFQKRGVAIVGCSTDTAETHLAWLSTPKTNFPVLSMKAKPPPSFGIALANPS